MGQELLLKLLQLTNAQTQALASEDLERFEELMQERQQVIDELECLSKRESWQKVCDNKKLLDTIVKQDKENHSQFLAQLEVVKQKLQEMRAKKKVENAYAQNYDLSVEEGVFFDKK